MSMKWNVSLTIKGKHTDHVVDADNESGAVMAAVTEAGGLPDGKHQIMAKATPVQEKQPSALYNLEMFARDRDTYIAGLREQGRIRPDAEVTMVDVGGTTMNPDAMNAEAHYNDGRVQVMWFYENLRREGKLIETTPIQD